MTEQTSRLEKRTAILEAALAAYACYGIHNATMRQIADIAGIGKSTIFEYFKSSTELMDDAFAHLIARSAEGRMILRESAGSDPARALSGYFDGMISLIVNEPGKLLLISQYVTAILASGTDFSRVKARYGEMLQPSAQSLLADFRCVVESGIRAGAFQPAGNADPEDCALMLSAVAREMQAQAFVQDEAQIRQTCRRLKRMAFRFLGSSADTI